jgi:hypothetical protein
MSGSKPKEPIKAGNDELKRLEHLPPAARRLIEFWRERCAAARARERGEGRGEGR